MRCCESGSPVYELRGLLDRVQDTYAEEKEDDCWEDEGF